LGNPDGVRLTQLAPFFDFTKNMIASNAKLDYGSLAILLLIGLNARVVFGGVRRSVQAVSLSIIPLPALIYLTDRHEFFLHVTNVTAFLPFVTNAFVLVSAIGVFVVCSFYNQLKSTLTVRIRQVRSRVSRRAVLKAG